MKKNLLLISVMVFFTISAMSQDIDFLKNGNMEEQGAWEIVANDGDAADVTWEFGTIGTPLEGDGLCLNVSWENLGTPLNQILYQVVTLTIGDTYTFSGAFKDNGTNADANQLWHQVLLTPVAADDGDISNGIEGGPHWTDNNATIILNHGTGWDVSWLGLGKNTTYEDDMNPDVIYGSDYSIFHREGQGDTNIYTVPETLFRMTDTLVLGTIGDKVDYYIALQVGQWMEEGSGIVNTFKFNYDEFKLMGPDNGSSINDNAGRIAISTYPNPINDVLNVRISNTINTLSINNILGQEVMRVDNINNTHTQINTTDFLDGVYIIMVTDKNGETYSSKIIKK